MATLQDLQNQRQNFFKQQRALASGAEDANLQKNREALQRRFTSMGAANTGAALKADQDAINQSALNRQQALAGIGAQELQAGEGDIGRQFQAEQGDVGRKFQSQQEDLARQFQAGQGDVGRKFQEMMADKDIGFKRGLADTEQMNKLKQMDLMERQFDQDKMIQEFNKQLAQQALDSQREAAEKGFLGGIGDQIFGKNFPGLSGGGGLLSSIGNMGGLNTISNRINSIGLKMPSIGMKLPSLF